MEPFGILNVDKPQDWTSFDVVALVRRLTKVRRVGHGGTLDPMATGVLPVFLGRATRLVEYLNEASKTYHAELMLGVATDTYDAQGNATFTGDPSRITYADIENALVTFIGKVRQTPPAYSAIKHKGRPLYSYARSGAHLPQIEEREVVIHRIAVVDFQLPALVLDIECGKGTYVRSLAHDLGMRLGCGAHLTALRRSRVGPFTLLNASTVDQLRSAASDGSLASLFYSPDTVLMHWRAAILGDVSEKALGHGQRLSLGAAGQDAELCRAYSHGGRFLAVLRYEKEGNWEPKKVF